jgi:hypothetical protein
VKSIKELKMFVKMTYIDNVTEVLCTRAPTLNGPRLPRLKGLNSVFYVHANLDIAISDQGIYTGVPLIYGICEDDADMYLVNHQSGDRFWNSYKTRMVRRTT